jgi:membrane-bound ClpP family serine protease
MDPLVWSLLLLLAAVLLLVLEIFVPTGGVLGVLSAVTLIAAICVGFSGGPLRGMMVLLLAAVSVPAVLAAAVKWWPHTPIGRLMLIRPPDHRGQALAGDEADRTRQALLGKFGRAKTKMLPSGAIVIDGRTMDALSEGMAIEAGQPVQVISVRTNRILVRPAEEHQVSDQTGRSAEDPDALLSRPIDSLGLESLEDPLA